MELLANIHSRFGIAFIIVTLICSIWAFFLYFAQRPMSNRLFAAVILAEGLILFQGLFGLILYGTGGHPRSPIHWIYGVAAALTLPIANQYLRGRKARTRMLFLAILCLFIAALGVRGLMTAGTLG